MAPKNVREATFIERVNEFIASNIKDEGFRVSELANKMHMSRSNLHRRIKSGTGISVSQFIRNARLKKALELLQKDPLTVAEAAYMTGFRSATYFSKCFSDYFGYPPVEVIRKAFDISDPEDRKEGDASEESRNLMHNFPVQTASFIGRENEIGTIISLIEKHRIVTLTGIGGTSHILVKRLQGWCLVCRSGTN